LRNVLSVSTRELAAVIDEAFLTWLVVLYGNVFDVSNDGFAGNDLAKDDMLAV